MIERNTEWEYCELELNFNPVGVITSKGWIYRKDRNHIEIKVPKYGAAMAELGEQGWELVGSSHHSTVILGVGAHVVSLYFKRPLEQS